MNFLPLFSVLGCPNPSAKDFRHFAEGASISPDYLKYLHVERKIPAVTDLKNLCAVGGVDGFSAKLKLGLIDSEVRKFLVDGVRPELDSIIKNPAPIKPDFSTKLGRLFRTDCMTLLAGQESEKFDMIFADPPFNLNKSYASNIDDALIEEDYMEWCLGWIDECIRTLKFGGALFLYNIPKWNSLYSGYLHQRLTFRHWIAVDLKYSLPISGRLYPAHYSILYFVKGKRPNSFHPDRMPMEVCKKCFGDLKDYGGYKAKMNPSGVNLTDIWRDIPPVRHSKYKRRKEANELSIKLMDRVVEMASERGDLIFDPFGGSGTTYAVAEIKGRRWMGCELGPIDGIVERFKGLEEESEFVQGFRSQYNFLFPEKMRKERVKRGLWTSESVREAESNPSTDKGVGELDLFLDTEDLNNRTGH